MKKYHDELLRNIWDLTEDKSSPIAQTVLKSSALPIHAYRDVKISKFSFLGDVIHNMRALADDGYSIVEDDIQVMIEKCSDYYGKMSYKQLRLPKEFYDELVAAYDPPLSYAVISNKLNAVDNKIRGFLQEKAGELDAYRRELGLNYASYDIADKDKWDAYSKRAAELRYPSLWRHSWLLHRVQLLLTEYVLKSMR